MTNKNSQISGATVAESATVVDKQLDWALEWLAYYKAQAEGVYADPDFKPTTVEELRKQSLSGGMPR